VAALKELQAANQQLLEQLQARSGAEAEQHLLQEQLAQLQDLQEANVRLQRQLEVRASVEAERRHLQVGRRRRLGRLARPGPARNAACHRGCARRAALPCPALPCLPAATDPPAPPAFAAL
jgi:hypothetical protein